MRIHPGGTITFKRDLSKEDRTEYRKRLYERRRRYVARTGRNWYMRTRFKWILTYSPRERKLRIGRLIWGKGKRVGDGKGYSAFLSIGLQPCWLFLQSSYGPPLKPDRDKWRLGVLGVVLHHRKSWGGYCCD